GSQPAKEQDDDDVDQPGMQPAARKHGRHEAGNTGDGEKDEADGVENEKAKDEEVLHHFASAFFITGSIHSRPMPRTHATLSVTDRSVHVAPSGVATMTTAVVPLTLPMETTFCAALAW